MRTFQDGHFMETFSEVPAKPQEEPMEEPQEKPTETPMVKIPTEVKVKTACVKLADDLVALDDKLIPGLKSM
jgi:hypothetical protein